MDIVRITDSVESMTSRDIAERTGKRHGDVMKKIRGILSDVEDKDFAQRNFSFGSYTDSQNQRRGQVIMTKSGSLFIASRYDVNVHLAVQLRWEELEKKFIIPQTLSEALRLASDQALKIETQETLLLEQKPKVEAYDVISNSNRLSSMDEVCKLFGMGRNNLYKWMKENGYIKKNRNVPYQKYVDNGLMDYRIDTKNNKTYYVTLITGKGILYFEKKLG